MARRWTIAAAIRQAPRSQPAAPPLGFTGRKWMNEHCLSIHAACRMTHPHLISEEKETKPCKAG